jgi:hypothetical protein
MHPPAHSLINSLLASSLVACCQASSLVVDWWTLNPSDNTELMDDTGTPVTIDLAVTSGTASPIFPLAGQYQNDYWSAPLPAPDSITNDFTLPTTDILVTPGPGGVAYHLTLHAPNLSGSRIAIGNLSPATTVNIIPRDFSDTALPGVTLLAAATWDAGFQPFDGPLSISADNTLLTAGPGNAEQSGFAFVALPASGVASVRLEVTNPSATLPGDLLSFSIGTPIPEPATGLLTLLSAAPLLRRHRPSRIS